MQMDIVFMGTPDFAVPTLEMLIGEEYNIKAVVTQPDRPKGRGKKLASPPVKQLAEKYHIPVLQPEKIRNDQEFYQKLKEIAPDLIVVVAFGQILPESILEIPSLGCVNVHASLLPKYRGSAPIHQAILQGDEMTGVTIMYMDVGMDTGDIITKTNMVILPDETAGALHDRMMYVGAEALRVALPGIKEQSYVPEKQKEEDATYAPMLDKQMGLIDWNQSAAVIERVVRGLNPWPAAYTYYEGKLLKIWEVEIITAKDAAKTPGQITDVIDDKGITVKTLDDDLLIKEIQAQGGKRMKMKDYMRGHEIKKDDFLGIR